MRICFTVYFAVPFWVGVFERYHGEDYSVSKVTFGAEPTDQEVYELILKQFVNLIFSQSESDCGPPLKRINPKRLQREVKKATKSQGIGTKAQQALKREQEQRKADARKHRRQISEQKEDERYLKRQLKRKAKHRGH